MGMTDKQFNGFIRLILDSLNEAKSEEDKQKIIERLERTIDILQQTLED